jgi:hypothetical protein
LADLAVYAMSTVEKSIKSIAKARLIASSLGKKEDAYKDALLCRLEVQYSLALLRNSYRFETTPPKLKRVKYSEILIEQIDTILATCEQLFTIGKVEEAFSNLLYADLLLGRLISHIRRIPQSK